MGEWENGEMEEWGMGEWKNGKWEWKSGEWEWKNGEWEWGMSKCKMGRHRIRECQMGVMLDANCGIGECEMGGCEIKIEYRIGEGVQWKDAERDNVE